ncbi:MAG: hypothetical protein HFI90_02560 [Clostridia bacterium]|nr:hypothetical protein [Clostridia bacterium]
MKKTKGVLSVLLTACILASALTVPIWAADPETGDGAAETTMWKSSDYLNPDSPITENNPWSVADTNTDDGSFRTITNTEIAAGTTYALFPQMPDGNTPTSGYIGTGNYNESGQWSKKSANSAVCGKYMIPGSLWHDDTKCAPNKIAKVFTAPKTGKMRISTVEGKLLLNKLSWEHTTLAWMVMKDDGTVLWKKEATDRTVGATYDTIPFGELFVGVTAGERIYFILQPRQDVQRAELACIWDPVIAYAKEVTDTDSFLSSKYLDPEVVYDEHNPWAFESKYSDDGNWVRTSITMETETKVEGYELFPTMPDGVKPTTGYIASGRIDGDGGWGVQGRNAAVNGKYMIPGFIYTDKVNECADNPIAKVFTAPKDGAVKISAAATLDGADGKLITYGKLGDNAVGKQNTYSLMLGSDTLWSADYDTTVHETDYDSIQFDAVYTTVKAGDKLYFIYDPAQFALRDRSALMWDPTISYAKEIIDTGSYLSSEYLDPDMVFAGTNPWSVESTNNAAGVWEPVAGTTMTPGTDAEFHLFPEMPDGVTPITGYISTGNYSGNWGNEGVNAAVNGKYMIAGAFWTSGDDSKKAVDVKIAKVFTVPEDGIIRIDAAAVMGNETEGVIIPSKVDEAWENEIAWSVEKNKKELWRETGEARRLGQSSYDSIRFPSLYEKVYAGEKIYFVLSPRKWSVRDGQSCMWDPRVTYIGKEIRVDDSSRDKADMKYPIDHQFELTLTGAPLASISASNITILGGDGRAKAADVVSNGDTLTFKVDGLQEDMDYKLCVNDIACAPKLEGEFVYANIDFPFSTAEACSLQSGIFVENGLHMGENKVCASVVCSDRTKIANGDTFIMIAAVMNSDGSVHKVYTSGASMNSRITDISCNVTVAEGQWIRAWVAESLNHIKPFGTIADIVR